jgi:hypothetical protein
MRTAYLRIFLAFLTLSGAGLMASSSRAGTLYDNFHDNLINTRFWDIVIGGSGPSVAAANQRLEITIPQTSWGEEFSGNLQSKFTLIGDYDMQIDFSLLIWPENNGVRIGLQTSAGAVERTSDLFFGGEVYITDFGGTITTVPTSHTSGRLRLKKTGSLLQGFYWNNGWVLIGFRDFGTADDQMLIRAWSHDFFFKDMDVQVGFDNFRVTNQAVGTALPQLFLMLD